MIIGQYTSKLTDKDRISIPKKFREELGEELIVARWYENCLVVVGKEGWKDLEKRLIGENKLVISTIRDIDRFILGSAFETRLDKQGRFVVPTVLLEFAEIENEVVFVGLGDRIEIWSQNKWKTLEAESEEKASEALEKLSRRSRKKNE